MGTRADSRTELSAPLRNPGIPDCPGNVLFMDQPKPELSIVAPCYNEAEGLPELVRRITAVGSSLAQSYELVLINDGSRDGTWPAIVDLASRDPQIVGVNLSRNHGHQLALT